MNAHRRLLCQELIFFMVPQITLRFTNTVRSLTCLLLRNDRPIYALSPEIANINYSACPQVSNFAGYSDGQNLFVSRTQLARLMRVLRQPSRLTSFPARVVTA